MVLVSVAAAEEVGPVGDAWAAVAGLRLATPTSVAAAAVTKRFNANVRFMFEFSSLKVDGWNRG